MPAFTKEYIFANIENDKDLNLQVDTLDKAKNGNANALYDIGWRYHYFKRQLEIAMAWSMLSANEGSCAAQYHLVFMHYHGYGTKNDCLAAFAWSLKSVKQFNTDAWGRLGRMFVAGHGVPRNEYKALEWFYHADKNIRQIRVLEGKGFKITEHDKKRSVNQLINETEEILSAALERKDKENKISRSNEKRPRSKKLTKEEPKQNFNPFVFHAKRK